MSTIDIRGIAVSPVTRIVFADQHESFVNATHLIKGDDLVVRIYDEDDDFLNVTSAEHAENLIKALHKAIELKWVE